MCVCFLFKERMVQVQFLFPFPCRNLITYCTCPVASISALLPKNTFLEVHGGPDCFGVAKILAKEIILRVSHSEVFPIIAHRTHQNTDLVFIEP